MLHLKYLTIDVSGVFAPILASCKMQKIKLKQMNIKSALKNKRFTSMSLDSAVSLALRSSANIRRHSFSSTCWPFAHSKINLTFAIRQFQPLQQPTSPTIMHLLPAARLPWEAALCSTSSSSSSSSSEVDSTVTFTVAAF